MSHGSAAVVDRQLEGLSHRRSQICFRNSAWDCRGHDEAAIQGVETTVTIGNESETQETSVATSPASADTRSTIRTSRSDIPSMDSPDQAMVYTIDRGPRGQVVVVGDGSALARAAAERFARAVEEAVAARGQVFVALSGGSTPKQMGTILTREPYRSRIPWDRVQVFWGDERWVPLGSPESNAGEARRGFLDLVPIPPTNVSTRGTPRQKPRKPPRQPMNAFCATSLTNPRQFRASIWSCWGWATTGTRPPSFPRPAPSPSAVTGSPSPTLCPSWMRPA